MEDVSVIQWSTQELNEIGRCLRCEPSVGSSGEQIYEICNVDGEFKLLVQVKTPDLLFSTAISSALLYLTICFCCYRSSTIMAV